jgi:hypothetical protein
MARRSRWPKKWLYIMLPKEMLFKREWKELSPAAKIIYLYLKAKWSPHKPRIRLYHSKLKDIKGLKSPNTRCRGFRELEEKGWVIRTELGGLFRHFNEYELTGKHDPSFDWIKVFQEKGYK